MARRLIEIVKPPSAKEISEHWKGIMVGVGFVLLMLSIAYFNDPWKPGIWYLLAPFFVYALVFLPVIESRISGRDKDR
mgnify:CR=1 FL=1